MEFWPISRLVAVDAEERIAEPKVLVFFDCSCLLSAAWAAFDPAAVAFGDELGPLF